MKGKITKTVDRMAVREKIVKEFVKKHGRKPNNPAETGLLGRKADYAVREAEGRDVSIWAHLKDK